MSALAPAPGGGCDWRRVDPATSQTILIEHLDASCDGFSISWDSLGTRALLATTAAAWSWSSGSLTQLPAPQIPEIESEDPATPPTNVRSLIRAVGFAPDGAPQVTVEATAEVVFADWTRCLQTETEQRLTGSAWVVQRTNPPPGCGRTGSSAPATGAFPRLRPFSGEPLQDETLLYRLETAMPRPTAVPVLPGPEVYAARETLKAESARTSAQTAESLDKFLRAANRTPAPGFRPEIVIPSRARAVLSDYQARKDRERAERDAIWTGATFRDGITLARRLETWAFVSSNGVTAPQNAPAVVETAWVREPYLLLTAPGGTTPRLYDGRTGALVWSSDDAHAVTFWPKPASPDGTRVSAR